MNLVPGDSSLEHTLQMGNPIDEADFTSGGVVFNQIMKDYFISEVEVARAIVTGKQVHVCAF